MVHAKDIQGRSPLHMAILVGHKEAVEHIVTNFPVAMKCKDNVSMNLKPNILTLEALNKTVADDVLFILFCINI